MPRPLPRSTLFPYTTLFRSTPMRSDGTVDYDGAARLADYLVTDMRNDGLVVNGTTGEAPTTSEDRKSTRLNSSHLGISYAVFCLKKKISTSAFTILHDSITT